MCVLGPITLETKGNGTSQLGDLLFPPVNSKLRMDERLVQWVMDKPTLLDGRHERNHNQPKSPLHHGSVETGMRLLLYRDFVNILIQENRG